VHDEQEEVDENAADDAGGDRATRKPTREWLRYCQCRLNV
jgi:hypothetical protein